MSKPLVIGLTLDSEQPGGYSNFPWYAIRENYCTAITRAGGVPLPLPHEPTLVETYANMIDGLVVTGGAFDLDPSLYGDATRHDTVVTKDRRTRFEFDIVLAMLAANKPVLGICGGQQLLNVVLGGSLIQHIPDSVPNALAHEQPNPRNEPGHDIEIVAGTLLHRVMGLTRVGVNSAHHQAVRDTGPGVVINARADDGVIEGIEAPGYRFCLGVQWHPEFEISAGDTAIFSALVTAAQAETQS
jgi:putative glutamine amidotransferase